MEKYFFLFISIMISHFSQLILAVKGNAGDIDLDKVVDEVKREITAFGEDSKKNYTELRKEWELAKETLSEKKFDAMAEEKFNKLGTAMLTRQDELDKKNVALKAELHKRMDDMEIIFKRPGKGTVGNPAEAEKEAKTFFQHALAVKGTEGGATAERMDSMKINVDEFESYRKNFVKFLRQGDKIMNSDEHKAMLVGSDPDGGLTVTPAMSARIINRQYEIDPIRQLASVETISTQALEMMTDFGQFGYGWEGEAVAGAETETSLMGKKRIPVHIMYAKPKATQMLIEDSSINIENWIADKVAARFGRIEAESFVTGDGVGKPRGFLTYADYTTAGTFENGKIEQIHMGAAAAITADGFYNVKYGMVEYYLNSTGLAWLLRRSTALAALKLKDGAGNYLWTPGFTEKANSVILGIPVRMSPTMPAVAANAMAVVLAEWKEAYLIVDRLGITVQRDPYTKKPFIEFYTRKRVGGDVVNYEAIKIGTIEA